MTKSYDILTAQRTPDGHKMPEGVHRVLYYNPKLDPYVIQNKMTKAMAEAVERGTYDNGSVQQGGPLLEPDATHTFNLISSLCSDGLHRPALDVDLARSLYDETWILESTARALEVPIDSLTAAPSTTNWHVYGILPALPWDDYSELIRHCGLLEGAYVRASEARRQTLLRPPFITKVIVS